MKLLVILKSFGTLVADEDSQEIATASFENKASNEIHGGYGIVNNYKYSKEVQDYTVKQSKEIRQFKSRRIEI